MSDNSQELFSRMGKLEGDVHKVSITQAEQLVLLKHVIETLHEEKNNSSRITVLETNWKWARFVITALVLPVVWLVAKSFL